MAQRLEANRPNLAVTTYDQYCNILNNHIRPYFDSRGITVTKLTAGGLEDYFPFKYPIICETLYLGGILTNM